MPAARTVDDYIKSLPDAQRTVLEAVRALVLRHLPRGFQESMTWGIPTYEVPLDRYPDTYNGKPLGYAGFAAKKNYYTLHLMNLYADPELLTELQRGFERHGKKLDMGKACVRFKQLDDLPLDVIASVVAGTSVDEYIGTIAAQRRQARRTITRRTAARSPSRRQASRAARKRPAAKTATDATSRDTSKRR